MIKTKSMLKTFLEEDKKVFDEYINNNFKSAFFLRLTNDHLFVIRKYIVLLRKTQYYYYMKERAYAGGCKHYLNIVFYTYYTYRKNRVGNKLGFYIPASADIGKGLLIYHHGGLIINGTAKIGDHAKFHGNNCVGNSGNDTKAPIVGNDVEFGFGASAIGNIKIDHGAVIGAGAVVVHSTDKENQILIGVPATKRNKKL